MDGTWTEHSTPEGRKYWYNTSTKKSVWIQPDEISGGSEALSQQPWKEYTAEGGRKYYHNASTNATVWDMPEVYRAAIAASATSRSSSAAVAPTFVAGSGASLPQYQPQRARDELVVHDGGRYADRQDRHNSHVDPPPRSSFVVATSNDPDYATYEEAEAAFMKLLKRSNVQPDWTWEQTMRAIIQDPQYRSLKDPKERKAAFEKYVVESRVLDKEREKERLAKLRADFTNMLRSHSEIKPYTRWKTARLIIEGETIFRSASDDTERRQLFEDYIVQLKKTHIDAVTATRKAALDGLASILDALNLEPYTRWSDAESKIELNERYRSDDKFKALTKSEVLTAFEQHIKSLERTFNDVRQLDKTQRSRRERRNRDQFISLLKDLKAAGRIRAGTKWIDIHPMIAEDLRYMAMLGQMGSTPMDLFWDVVEEEERVLRGKRVDVLDVLDDKRFEMTTKTKLDEFMAVMQTDRRTSSVDAADLDLIFSRLLDKIIKREEEDKHNLERHQRRNIDNLRSRIRHLEPPVRSTDQWEDVRPRIERSEEYRTLDSDDLARTAFDKVVRRLKDKEAEARERARRSDRAERDARTSAGYRHASSRHSRTPELDPYEADRRRAMAERERQYSRKASNGLSPPRSSEPRRREPRERDARDERDVSRPRRAREGPPSERERRDRVALERDRSYVSRADPRDGGARALDYGESGTAGSANEGSSGTRRRASDADEDETRRDSKRLKTTSGTKTSNEVPSAKEVEEEVLKSGSEEGEIEED